MKAACQRDFKERAEKRIKLPDVDARIFAPFVEWMYYGDYTIPYSGSNGADNISINAKCWVLGDRILSTKFKNHAMSELHAQHTSSFAAGAVSTQDVLYAFENSGEGSKLQLFYSAYVVQHFSNFDRLHGGAEEWDELLSSRGDLRLIVLENLRKRSRERIAVKDQNFYLEEDVSLADTMGSMSITNP